MPFNPHRLEKLCIDFVINCHSITDTGGNLIIRDLLALSIPVRAIFFELYKEKEQRKIPYSFAIRLIGQDTRILNMKGVKPFSVIDFALDLRQKGVHQLKSLELAPWWDSLIDQIHPQQLVPNENLVKIFVRQLYCTTEDMATFAFKFPNLREITVTVSDDCSFECLSKMENLQEFHFFYGNRTDDDMSSDVVASKLLYRLLRSVPTLLRAGRMKSGTSHIAEKLFVDDMTEALSLCNTPLKLTFATVETFKIGNVNLGRLLPNLNSLDLTVTSKCAVENFLNFPHLQFLELWPMLNREYMDQFYAALVNRYKDQAEIKYIPLDLNWLT